MYLTVKHSYISRKYIVCFPYELSTQVQRESKVMVSLRLSSPFRTAIILGEGSVTYTDPYNSRKHDKCIQDVAAYTK